MRVLCCLFVSFLSVRSPGASRGGQQQKGGSSGGVSPWRLGEYLRLGLEWPERSCGVQTARTQVNVNVPERRTVWYRKIKKEHIHILSLIVLSGGAVAAGGFGQGKGPIHLDQVRCTGKEEFLGECPSLGQSFQGCRRRDDAGVSCDVTPRETPAQAKPQEQSCGLRKLVEEESKRRSRGEDNMLT